MNKRKMFFYKLGYSSWDASGSVVLMHKRSFRKHEFNKMVIDCSIEAAREFFINKTKIYKEMRNSEGIDKENFQDKYINICYSDIYTLTASLMCKKYGFILPQFKQSYFGEGDEDLRQHNSEWTKDTQTDRLLKKINQEIINELGESTDYYKEFYYNKKQNLQKDE